jgi:hypothetical protein
MDSSDDDEDLISFEQVVSYPNSGPEGHHSRSEGQPEGGELVRYEKSVSIDSDGNTEVAISRQYRDYHQGHGDGMSSAMQTVRQDQHTHYDAHHHGPTHYDGHHQGPTHYEELYHGAMHPYQEPRIKPPSRVSSYKKIIMGQVKNNMKDPEKRTKNMGKIKVVAKAGMELYEEVQAEKAPPPKGVLKLFKRSMTPGQATAKAVAKVAIKKLAS